MICHFVLVIHQTFYQLPRRVHSDTEVQNTSSRGDCDLFPWHCTLLSAKQAACQNPRRKERALLKKGYRTEKFILHYLSKKTIAINQCKVCNRIIECVLALRAQIGDLLSRASIRQVPHWLRLTSFRTLDKRRSTNL